MKALTNWELALNSKEGRQRGQVAKEAGWKGRERGRKTKGESKH